MSKCERECKNFVEEIKENIELNEIGEVTDWRARKKENVIEIFINADFLVDSSIDEFKSIALDYGMSDLMIEAHGVAKFSLLFSQFYGKW